MNSESVRQAYAILLRQKENASIREISKLTGISKSTVHRLLVRRCDPTGRENVDDKYKRIKPGPKPKLDPRDKRILMRTFYDMRRNNKQITVMSLVREAGLETKGLHRRTFSRYLNGMGFKFLQARKKGLLSEQDKKKRMQYATLMRKTVLSHSPDFYSHHISFYLDGVSFIHKFNPMKDACQTKNKVWRKAGEGLQLTARGSKELAGGRRLHLMVAIAHGNGVVMMEPYDKMSGEYFSRLIRDKFNITFAKAGRKSNGQRQFVMDNDPCQTSKRSLAALDEIEAILHRIPARSPDLNPIENIFHLVKKRLAREAFDKKIEKESFDEFKERVFRCFETIDRGIIDRTIESMPKRIEAILNSRGCRSKY